MGLWLRRLPGVRFAQRRLCALSRKTGMTYQVKEIYYTLQGEGARAGRAAVFLRFAGCNLWSGREEDRGTATCQFCDTDFVGTTGPGGGKFARPEALASAVAEKWPASGGKPHVGGPRGGPLLPPRAPPDDAFPCAGFGVR